MLKKVIFAAVLAMGFVTSFKVGAAVDTAGAGAMCYPLCDPKCTLDSCD
jgi:energy-converting hydrogenase Eha subunit C